ncbi:hypothetical protein V7103_24795, partial [Neobacillus drentensis]|uniref:OmpL47-type beta-barrel domain-containing protein n=1 Tax=Neobacillus drentensis TaxID=220684 RepID=UPI00302DA695
MQIVRRKISFLVLAVLFLQLLSPITSAFAASNLTTAPANLRYYPDGIDNFLIRWDGVTGASGYRVYEKVGEENILKKQTTNLYLYFASIPEGTHTYTVIAYNSTGESPFSTSLNVEIKYPDMQSPSGLTSSIVNGNDVSLKWNAVEFATTYKVFEVKDGQRVLLASPTKPNQYFTNVSEGEHVYEITSYNTQYGESTPSSLSVNVVFPDMAAPTGLTAYINDINNVLFRWNAVPYAESYNVYQIVDGARKLIATTTDIKQYLSNLPEGENIYEVTSYNSKYGESVVGSKSKFTVTYPEILPPQEVYPYFYNGNDLFLMWSAAGYAEQYKLYQLVDGQKELITTTTNRSHYFSNLPEGDYTFEIVSVSSRFGESTAKTYDVTVQFPEMQAPKASIDMDTPTSAVIGWSSVPYATEYEVYKLVDGVPTLIGTTTSTKTSYYVSDLPQGKHEYMVLAKSDRFGKSAYSNIVVAEVKPALPAPVASAPEVKGDSVQLTWEPVVEADKYNVYKEVDGERVLVGTTTEPTIMVDTPEEQGTHEYLIVPVTKDGVESIDYATVEVVIDQPSDVTAPVTVAETTDKWSKEDVSVKLTATDDLSGVKSTFYSINHSEFVEGTQLTLNLEGMNTVSFYSVDNAGNVEEVKTVEVKIDKQAPETVINASAYWYNNKVDLELTAIDDLSGVKASYYSVDNGAFAEGTQFSIEESGIHTVSFYSVDNVGNVEEARTVEVKIDNQAPKTTAEVKNNSLVELTATDDLSGVQATYYSVNGSDFKEGTSLEVTQAGVNKVTFYSIDKAGNYEEQQTIEVVVDKTAPVTVSNIEDQWYTETANVELKATDDLSGVKTTYYSIDGADFSEGSSFTIEKEGTHTVTFYSVDNAGNIEVKNIVEVKVDKTAPTTVSNIEDQ